MDKRKWSKELIDEINRLKMEGKTYKEITDGVGVPYSTMRRWLSNPNKDFSVSSKKFNFKRNDIEFIIKLYQEKKTLRYIGNHFNCDKATIKRVLEENGVSIRASGDTMRGRNLSDEHKDNISKANMGREVSKETREKLSESTKYRFSIQEERDKISRANKGKERSQELRAKISESLKGYNWSEERNAKISMALKGKKKKFYNRTLSKQQKENISKSLMGRKLPRHVTEKIAKTIHEKHLKTLETKGLTLDDKEYYYKRVWYFTNKNYRRYKHIINPQNLDRTRFKYNLDHKYSIIEGFYNSVPPELIAHQCNLEMKWWRDNYSKNRNCDITLNELYRNIRDFNKSGGVLDDSNNCEIG